MVPINMSDQDKKTIQNCHEYRRYKKLTLARFEYSKFEVGTAIFIKDKNRDEFLRKGSDTKQPRYKFVIIENDDGFLFAKRVLATGLLGKEIISLTTDYSPENFELVVDEAIADAILLDEEYDPASDALKLKKIKNKVTNINNKNRIIFNDAVSAYNFIKTLKVGDKLWSSFDTYCSTDVTEFDVVKVEEIPIKNAIKVYGANFSSYYYQKIINAHSQYNFDNIIKVEVEEKTTSSSQVQTLYFASFCRNNTYYIGYNALFFNKKPISISEMTDVK